MTGTPLQVMGHMCVTSEAAFRLTAQVIGILMQTFLRAICKLPPVCANLKSIKNAGQCMVYVCGLSQTRLDWGHGWS